MQKHKPKTIRTPFGSSEKYNNMNVCVQFQASKNAFTLHGFCRLYGSQCESRRTEIDYFISIDLLVFNLKKTKEEKKIYDEMLH